jgi:hypothetical protein
VPLSTFDAEVKLHNLLFACSSTAFLNDQSLAFIDLIISWEAGAKVTTSGKWLL